MMNVIGFTIDFILLIVLLWLWPRLKYYLTTPIQYPQGELINPVRVSFLLCLENMGTRIPYE